jgi:hypothetical protein
MKFKIESYKDKTREFSPFPFDKDGYIGGGSYADIYKSSKFKDRVVKVAQGNDEGFLTFLEALAKESKTNPHFPVIYRAALVEHVDGGSYTFNRIYVEMERLFKLPCAEYKFGTYCPLNETAHIVEALDWESNHWRRQWVLHGTDLAQAREWLIKLYKQKKKEIRELSNDIHDENIMIRKDGTIVITDPFATLGW